MKKPLIVLTGPTGLEYARWRKSFPWLPLPFAGNAQYEIPHLATAHPQDSEGLPAFLLA